MRLRLDNAGTVETAISTIMTAMNPKKICWIRWVKAPGPRSTGTERRWLDELCRPSLRGFGETSVGQVVRVLESSESVFASDPRLSSRPALTASYRRARGAVQLVIGMVAS